MKIIKNPITQKSITCIDSNSFIYDVIHDLDGSLITKMKCIDLFMKKSFTIHLLKPRGISVAFDGVAQEQNLCNKKKEGINRF